MSPTLLAKKARIEIFDVTTDVPVMCRYCIPATFLLASKNPVCIRARTVFGTMTQHQS